MDILATTHYLNGLSGILAVICGIYIYKFHHFQYLPKNLRILVWCHCFPAGTLVSILSAAISIFALITKARVTTDGVIPTSMLFNILRISIITVSQQLRLSFCIIVLERLIATIFLEKYSKYPKQKLFVIFVFLSLFSQLIVSVPSYSWIFCNVRLTGYEAMIWIAFLMHFLTLISCKILYDKNQQMYKRLAYHCTLQQRHQILENIKALKSLWPLIFIFSVIAPIGPMISLIYSLMTKEIIPLGLFYTTYNCTIIILAAYYIFLSSQKDSTLLINPIQKGNLSVLSPLGRTLPTHVSMDNYFNDLRNQWT